MTMRFRPLTGCKLFLQRVASSARPTSFRPLTGCKLFLRYCCAECAMLQFPSPYGVQVVSFPPPAKKLRIPVSVPLRGASCFDCDVKCSPERFEFPSPYGVQVVSAPREYICVSYPSFRPLTGCKLFPGGCRSEAVEGFVSVPLRGASCFQTTRGRIEPKKRFRPLTGCKLFHTPKDIVATCDMFPSPYGVQVVSAACTDYVAGVMGRFRPLTGCKLFHRGLAITAGPLCFRPLTGCKLFLPGKGKGHPA